MDILVNKRLGNCRAYFEISVNGEEWQQQLQDSSALLQKYVKLPGYEDGNAPVDVVLAQFGDNLLRDRAARRRMTDNLNVLIPSTGLNPVSIPENNIIRVSKDELYYSCAFDYMPVIQDLQFKGVVVEKPVRACTEKDIDKAVKRYMTEHPALRPVNRKARKNDTVELTFTGTLDGKPVDDGKAKTTRMVLGKDELFAGLDKHIHGHAAGERCSVVLVIPTDPKEKNPMAGKTLNMDLTINGIWEFYTPDLTDDYVKEYAEGTLATVEELRTFLRNKVEAELAEVSNGLLENRINRALAGLITCDLPQSMLNTFYQKGREEIQHIATVRGVTVPALLAANGTSLEAFNRSLREDADMNVRQFLACDYIARTGELTVSAEEINAYYERIAKGSGKTAEEWKQYNENDEKAVEDILMEKAAQYFRDNLVVKEVIVDKLPRM